MPPRRSARLAGGAPAAHGAVLFPPLAPLPLALVLHIFSLLPLDARLRCAMVSRGWRVTFSERSLWARLDLSPASSLARAAATNALLSAAAARAGGQLQALDISCCERLTFAALLAVVRANAGALQALRACSHGTSRLLGVRDIEAVLRAAPQLRSFDADVTEKMCDADDACRMLRNEAPFGPLRLQRLWTFTEHSDDILADGAPELASAIVGHASLMELVACGSLAAPASLDAVVDAALARRLVTLGLFNSDLGPAAAPALARLLRGDALRTFNVCGRERPAGGQDQLLDATAAAALSSALQTNTTLTHVSISDVGLWHDPASAAVLLGALTAHPSLRIIQIEHNEGGMHVNAAVADALGALVAANAPALQVLNLDECELDDDALRPLFEALPANTHLQQLHCKGNRLSGPFARDVALPAIRANTSLIGFSAPFPAGVDAVDEIVRLVNARATALGLPLVGQ
jgi:hypothetical protein